MVNSKCQSLEDNMATPAPVTPEPAPEPEPKPIETADSDTTLSGTTLTLQFGGGESFTINMYDNDTAN